jgi:pimeloyl-ACP methyl ester carboxylesterase/DNA-binding winged helix-turn-helix (wHTH) protein
MSLIIALEGAPGAEEILLRYDFDGYVLDTGRMELRHDGKLVEVEPQVFDLLAFLIQNQDRVVSNEELFDAVWQGRIVSLSTLTSRINAARKAVGDSGAKQKLIKTLPRRGYRFVGQATPDSGEEQPAAEPEAALHQEILFCTSGNDVRIAYAKVGQGPPLIKAGNWLNHLEYDWESPVWSHLLKWMASDHQLIRYDARGNGLSDWDVQDISFDAFVRDLEAVVEAAGHKRFALFGASQGCAVSIAYAVKHPERVSKLVLYGGFARGRRLRGDPLDIEQADAMITLMRTGWGAENPAFRQVFTSLFVPGGTPEQVRWFNDLQRNSTSPENAVRIRLVSDYMDVRKLLPLVKAPTLVLHCHDDAVQPFEEGRILAAGIPGARFVGLEGQNHLILETDPGWRRFQEEIAAFLAA